MVWMLSKWRIFTLHQAWGPISCEVERRLFLMVRPLHDCPGHAFWSMWIVALKIHQAIDSWMSQIKAQTHLKMENTHPIYMLAKVNPFDSSSTFWCLVGIFSHFNAFNVGLTPINVHPKPFYSPKYMRFLQKTWLQGVWNFGATSSRAVFMEKLWHRAYIVALT